jgi:hypothetical protein
MEDRIDFAPAIPFPRSFDVQKRIQQLHGYLDSNDPNSRPGLDISQLSEVGIRDVILFMGIAPGTHLLAASATTDGLASLLYFISWPIINTADSIELFILSCNVFLLTGEGLSIKSSSVLRYGSSGESNVLLEGYM